MSEEKVDINTCPNCGKFNMYCKCEKSKSLLSELQEAWQKLQPIIESLVDTKRIFSERVLLREQFGEFGVLLQRLEPFVCKGFTEKLQEIQRIVKEEMPWQAEVPCRKIEAILAVLLSAKEYQAQHQKLSEFLGWLKSQREENYLTAPNKADNIPIGEPWTALHYAYTEAIQKVEALIPTEKKELREE